jgi:hypothetical protein
MAPITVAVGPCRCVSKGTVYVIYDDDPEISATHPPVANCDQCSTPSEALLVQSGFQTR